MDLQQRLNQLMGPTDNRTKMKIARRLRAFTGDSQVMDVLCTTAVYTDHHELRDVLLDVLKADPAGACVRFSDYARWAQDPVARAHALMNLGLMGCRGAKDAVINGLYDPDAAVRKAAAMSAGLYDDRSVLLALEHYFESSRFDLTLSFFADGLRLLRRKAARPDNDDLPGMTAIEQVP